MELWRDLWSHLLLCTIHLDWVIRITHWSQKTLGLVINHPVVFVIHHWVVFFMMKSKPSSRYVNLVYSIIFKPIGNDSKVWQMLSCNICGLWNVIARKHDLLYIFLNIVISKKCFSCLDKSASKRANSDFKPLSTHLKRNDPIFRKKC